MQNAAKIEASISKFQSLPDSLFIQLTNKNSKRFKESNIPLNQEFQVYVVAFKEGKKIKLINGTGDDIIAKYGNASIEIKKKSYTTFDAVKDQSKITIQSKVNSDSSFDIKIKNWISVVE